MLVFLGSSRVMSLHYFGMITVTLSESTDTLLLQTLEVLFLSFSYSRNWNLIYRSCLRASYRSEGRGERKQKKNVPRPLAPPPPPLFHSPLEVDLKTVCCIDFYSYISRPVYGEIIFVTLTLKSVDEILWCDHSNKTSSAHPHGTTYLVRCSHIWVLGWNPTVTIRMKPVQQYFPMVLSI